MSASSGTTRTIGREHGVVVGQVLVDLVGDDPDPVLERPATDRGGLLGGVDRTRGVRGRAEQERLGLRGPRGLELLDGHEVALVGAGEHLDRDAAREADGLRVGGPVRRREQDLVARVHDRRERLVDGLLAAVGHQHLRRLDLVPRVAQRLGGDGLAHRGQTGRRRVPVVDRVLRGGDRRVDDVPGRREVRLTGAEADDRAAGRLEGLRLGVDGQRRRLGDRGQPGGHAGTGRRRLLAHGPHSGRGHVGGRTSISLVRAEFDPVVPVAYS